uniref:Uncharacterized protein n=1 Tax=Amphimedon queenslandica TaxID=400682 RepID=A0A1X7TSI0_AMPQE
AAKRSDINMLKLILKPDMTYFKDGCTVMHVSAHEGFQAGIEYIMSLRPESVHDTDKMGRTPLHYAAAMDRVHVCYHLLNKGADASQRDSDNKTPLDYALIKQHEFVVALFTCHDASVGDFIKMQ